MTKYIVRLSEEEKKELCKIVKTGKSAARKIEAARILIEADEGNNSKKTKTDEDIASATGTTKSKVGRVRKRFVEEGLDVAIERRKHSEYKPKCLDGRQEAFLIAKACSSPPEGAGTWTLSLLKDDLLKNQIVTKISESTIGRTLKENDLKPWKKKCGPFQQDKVLNM